MFSTLRIISICFLVVFLTGSLAAGISAQPDAAFAADSDPVFVRLKTEPGELLGVFYPELAPHHVASFIHLVRSGFYTGTTFHRIVPGRVIQGGDPLSKDMDPRNDGRGGPRISDVLNEKDTLLLDQFNQMLSDRGYVGLDGEALLKAEFSKSAKHVRGTLSMARGTGFDSAGSQFFICVDKTPALDGQYTIFGYFFKGMDAADLIVSGEKNPSAGRDAPAVPVAIHKAEIIEGVAGLREDEKTAWAQVSAELRNVK